MGMVDAADQEFAQQSAPREEMDQVIGQFLDFARGEDAVALESRDVNDLVAPIVERSRKSGHDVRFAPGALPAVRLITRKPLTGSPQEIEKNARARSAKLRVAERL